MQLWQCVERRRGRVSPLRRGIRRRGSPFTRGNTTSRGDSPSTPSPPPRSPMSGGCLTLVIFGIVAALIGIGVLVITSGNEDDSNTRQLPTTSNPTTAATIPTATPALAQRQAATPTPRPTAAPILRLTPTPTPKPDVWASSATPVMFTPTPLPTATPIPRPTLTPTPRPTPIPLPTSTPTPSPPPAPTPTPLRSCDSMP